MQQTGVAYSARHVEAAFLSTMAGWFAIVSLPSTSGCGSSCSTPFHAFSCPVSPSDQFRAYWNEGLLLLPDSFRHMYC